MQVHLHVAFYGVFTLDSVLLHASQEVQSQVIDCFHLKEVYLSIRHQQLRLPKILEEASAAEVFMESRVCRISPFLVTRILTNSPAGAVSIRHRLRGPNRAAATACAAGADAIGDAYHLIRSGNADVMVAGGTEACVDAVALGAFGR